MAPRIFPQRVPCFREMTCEAFLVNWLFAAARHIAEIKREPRRAGRAADNVNSSQEL